ncbi:MAG TPA: PilZ domain-containing protein [Bryobacteraceae bacterium]|nr:PilZ domain-containing protein [Bryobacteraceae bacterium]
MDRRNKERLDLQLPCRVRTAAETADSAGYRRLATALTENVSRDGILMRWIETAAPPAIGASLIVDIELPDNPQFGPRLMRCNSTVVRIDNAPGSDCQAKLACSVALRIESIRFVGSAVSADSESVETSRIVRIRPEEFAAMPLATNRLM